MEYVDIEKLRKIVVEELEKYDGEEAIPLKFDKELLSKILFSEGNFAQPLSSILKKIDFSNVSFDGFCAMTYNFSGLRGVRLNPQKLVDKDLAHAKLAGVEFIGPFDNVLVYGADFTGSKGAKINPQKLVDKDLAHAKLAGVEFIGPFNNVFVYGADFTGSKGAKIDPQTIASKKLAHAKLADVEFIGPFDNVLVDGADFTGSRRAKIPPQNEEDFRQKIREQVLAKTKK